MGTADGSRDGVALRQALWLMLDRGGRLLIAFGISVWVARRLDPGVFGTLSYASATVGVLAFLSTLGLEAVVVKMLAEEPGRRDEILASAIAARAAGGALLVLAASAASAVLHPGQPTLQLITALIAFATLFQCGEVAEYWLRQCGRVQPAVAARLLLLLAGALARLWALRATQPLVLLAAIQAIEAMLIAIALLGLLARQDAGTLGRPRRARMAAMLRQASPLLISAIAVSLYARVGTLILGAVHGTAAVGHYGVAVLLSEATHALPVAVMGAFAPVLLRIPLDDGAGFERRWHGVLRRLVLAGVAVAVLVTLAAVPVVRLLFGDGYAAAGPVLAIHVWSALFVFVSAGSEPWFLRHGYLRYYPLKTLLGAITSVVLNLLLVPPLGAAGAALATVASYSVSAYWSNALLAQTRPLFRRQTAALALLPRYSG